MLRAIRERIAYGQDDIEDIQIWNSEFDAGLEKGKLPKAPFIIIGYNGFSAEAQGMCRKREFRVPILVGIRNLRGESAAFMQDALGPATGVSGTEAGNDALQWSARIPGSENNGIKIIIAAIAGTANITYSYNAVSREVTVRLRTDIDGNSLTTATELQTFIQDFIGGVSPSVCPVSTDHYGNSDGSGICEAAIITLTGGADDAPRVTFDEMLEKLEGILEEWRLSEQDPDLVSASPCWITDEEYMGRVNEIELWGLTLSFFAVFNIEEGD